MKRIVLGLAFALLMASLAAMAGCAPPTARVDEDTFDFGSIEQNTAAEHIFKIYNDGNKDLEITHTKSTCGCTVATPSKKTIKPGDFSEVKVTFNAGLRKGKQIKKVTVVTNDPANPKTTLTLTGEVAVTMAFDPMRARLSDLKPGEPGSQTVKFTNMGQEPITITEYKVDQKKAQAVALTFKKGEQTELPIALQPGEAMDITVTVTLAQEQPMYIAKADLLIKEKPETAPQLAISARLEGAIKTMKPMKMKNPKAPKTLKQKGNKNK
ncbi:MAG TPA: DUF1573 domain-containing protein [bacterium]|nr:DUF1573 domain-containing protein [bacterium]